MPEHEEKPKSSMATFFMNLLGEEGYRPWIDENGDIAFKSEHRLIVIRVGYEEKDIDREFFHMYIPSVFEIKTDTDRAIMEQVAKLVTLSLKVVKISVLNDRVIASVESFISPIQAVQDVFERYTRVLHQGYWECQNGYAYFRRIENDGLQELESDFESGNDEIYPCSDSAE
jgi:hypothetical protein